jgi:non-specific serine/threonine protein kinase
VIGETISHYRVTAKLGSGGMGEVYRAEDLKLNRVVALKLLPSGQYGDPQARRRLLREAQMASSLNHANIATIYEVDEAQSSPFIAMEYVEGESLKDLLLRGVLPLARVSEIAVQIAEGLRTAHQAGVVHRDLKPANVMIDANQRVKILDFGLAAMSAPERKESETSEDFVSRTQTQWTTAGTVPYMAPEQLNGDQVDARADIFSFGVLLHECITGRRPFGGSTTIDVLHAILRDEPKPLRALISDISPQWERLIDRLLAKNPGDRFQTMQEVLDALERATTAGGEEEQRSVAVLYFENMSESKEDAYFRDGMTEEIITEIAKIKELRVFPRTSVLSFKDKLATAPQIGRQLNALYVLEGSLRRAANRIRITARLVETRTGHAVWAERYDRNLEDVFAIQDEIAENIARALKVMLTEQEKAEIEKRPTSDVQAYDYYLRGMQFFHTFSRKGFEYARQMFERAIEIDSRYARAHAGLADCSSLLHWWWDASESNRRMSDEGSRKALDYDPDLAEAHVARGLSLTLQEQYEEAEEQFETAIRLDPTLFEAYYLYARACFVQKKLEKAVELYEKASAARPEDYQSVTLLASVYTGMGRNEEARSTFQKSVRAAEKHLELHPDDARALYLGANALCRLGESPRALEWAERALAMDSAEVSILYNVGCVYALVGKTDEALDCLEKALDNGFSQIEWIENDPDLDELRELDRFSALLKRLEKRP